MGKKALGQKAQSKLTSYSGYKRSVRKTGRKRNVFPFLELPVELRLQIYRDALPNGAYSTDRHRCHASGVRCMFEEERKYQYPHPKGFPALMSVNKLIHQETLDVLYGPLPPERSPIVQLDVGADHVQVRGYNLFCRKHHVFDKTAEGIFTRFPCVELNVHAYCDPWPEPEDPLEYEDRTDGEISEELQEEKLSYLRNNMRWVVSQLRKVKSLSNLVLNQVDDHFYECYGHSILMDDLEFMLSPLRQITTLEKAEFGYFDLCVGTGCDCSLSYDDENERLGTVLADFLNDLKTCLTSKKPVEEEPEVFNFYDDFIHRLKKCKLTGTNIDTTELLRAAQHDRENGHPACLRSVMNRFAIAFRAEVDQRMALCNDIESLVNKVKKCKQS